MASDPARKILAQERNDKMTADYGQRAAMALDRCIAGPHRDKAVARLFGVSVRMAQYLRHGQHWTTERLTQASEAFGQFDQFIATPNLHAELDRLEAEIAALRQHIHGSDRDDGL